MKTDYRLALLMILTVAASGCASTTNTDSSSGTGPISVNSFEAVPNPTSADRPVSISLELENTGGSDAEKVAATVFGPTFAQIKEDSDDVDSQTWRDSNGGQVGKKERWMNYGTLWAPGENTPSVPERQSLSFTAPALSQGREVDYGFNAKIFYKYNTTGSTDFSLVSGKRFQEENMERTETSLESSEGPIDLEIRGTTPKIFYRDDGESPSEQVTSEICVKVINEGTGTAFTGGETGNDNGRQYLQRENENNYKENTVSLTVMDIGNIDLDVKGTPEDGDDNDAEIELVGGQEGFQCFRMQASDLGGTEEQNVNTQITATYNYVKETETTVTVEGRRGLGGTPSNNNGGGEKSGNNNEAGELPDTPGN